MIRKKSLSMKDWIVKYCNRNGWRLQVYLTNITEVEYVVSMFFP